MGAVDLPGEEEPAAGVLTQDEQVRPTAALDDPGDDAGRLILSWMRSRSGDPTPGRYGADRAGR